MENIKENNLITTKVKWVLIIIGIIVILGVISYSNKNSILSHYEKFIDSQVEKKTKEISKNYEKQKTILEGQITNKQIEITRKDALLKIKEKKIKEANGRIIILQKKNSDLEKKLSLILLPLTPNETKKRLEKLGYPSCQ
jgi:protein subunit release factor A